jgi:hypothetical protein
MQFEPMRSVEGLAPLPNSGEPARAGRTGEAAAGTVISRLLGCEPKTFWVYGNEPLTLLAIKYWNANILYSMAVYFLVFIMPLVVMANLSGTLLNQGNVLTDLERLLHITATATQPSAAIPLLRDYSFLVIALGWALLLPLIMYASKLFTDLPDKLCESGLWDKKAIGDRAFCAVLAKYNRRMNSCWVGLGSLGGAAAFLAMSLVLSIKGGIYPSLDPSLPNSAQVHFLLWWTNPSTHPLAFSWCLLYYASILYVGFRAVAVVILYIFMLREVMRAPKQRGRRTLVFPSPWHDTSEALSYLGRCVLSVWMCLVLNAVVSMGILDGILSARPLTLFVTLLVLSYPFIAVYVVRDLNGALGESARRWRRESLDRLRSAHEQWGTLHQLRGVAWLKAERARAEFERARAEYDRASELPERVLDLGPLLRAFVVYLVPVVGLLVPFVAGH